MVNSILKRFPSLINESSDFNDAYSLWHSRIKSYFKNHRFRTSTVIPEIIQKKKIYGKRKDGAVVQNDSTSKKICFGVQNFLPDLPEGEDPHTWEKYQKELQNQMALTKEKKQRICMPVHGKNISPLETHYCKGVHPLKRFIGNVYCTVHRGSS